MISPKFTSAFNTEGPRGMNSERSNLSETIFLILNVVSVHVLNFTVFVVKDASTKCQLNHLSTEMRLMFVFLTICTLYKDVNFGPISLS